MATPRTTARGAQGTASVFNLAAFADALLASGSRGYGVSEPLYALIQNIGTPSKLINDLNTAFESHGEAAAALKEGEAAITVSVFDGREAFSLAVKAGGALYYFSLYHDKDGLPIVEPAMVLAKVQVTRDFSIEKGGPVILQKGREMFKAMPAEYAAKLKAAV